MGVLGWSGLVLRVLSGIDAEGRGEISQESWWVKCPFHVSGLAVDARSGLISLGGGLPSSEYFPLEHLDIKVPTPPGFSPDATRESGTVLRSTKNDIREGTSLYGRWCATVFGLGADG